MSIPKGEISIRTYFQVEWKLAPRAIVFKACKFIQSCVTTIVNTAGLQTSGSTGFLLVAVAKIGDKCMNLFWGGTLNAFLNFLGFCFVLSNMIGNNPAL